MIKFIFGFIFLLSFSSYSAPQKSVYGPDDRLDLYENMPKRFLEWAKSSAALVLIRDLKIFSDHALIESSPLKEALKVCPDEKFVEQPAASTCSGFLVAPDLMVTAGHCINPNEHTCGDRVWIFDYALNSSNDTGRVTPLKNIYFCREIVLRVHDGAPPWNDLALVRLDRPVLDRKPLVVRTKGKISSTANLVMFGNPSGLPLKVVAGGVVMSNNEDNYFTASLDAFGRNSGSAIIDVNTGSVEGILVRGEKDYQIDKAMNCLRPYTCVGEECKGSEATRITNFFDNNS